MLVTQGPKLTEQPILNVAVTVPEVKEKVQ